MGFCWAQKWYGFLLAKRSMPVVELPEIYRDDGAPSFCASDVIESLQSAGIKYKVRGE